MDDYVLTLNAGSSSLKFSVYRRRAADHPAAADSAAGVWRLEVQGQIKGIGASPQLTAKNADGDSLTEEGLGETVRDGGSALGALSTWLGARYRGGHVVGVGHRVVHGGAKYTVPTVVSPQ